MKLKFLILSLLSLACVQLRAAQVTIGDLTYITNSNGTASINGYIGEPTEIVIPETITIDETNYDVTIVKDNAFKNCTSLNKLTIPASITTIGNYVFNGCTGLKVLKIAESTATLSVGYPAYSYDGRGLFCDCPLDSLFIGRNIDYPYHQETLRRSPPFCKVTTIRYLRIGAKVTNDFGGIGNKTQKTIIDDSKTTLTAAPTSSQNLYVGRNVGSIAADTVYIGSKVTSLPQFGTVLSYIEFAPDVNISEIGNNKFSNCKLLKSFVIPKSVKTIKSEAFSGCSSLKEITIPANVTTLYPNAFTGATGIRKLTIEDSNITLGFSATNVTVSGSGLFADCRLEEIYYGRPLHFSHKPPFENGTLKNATITFGDCVSSIPDDKFDYGGIKTLRFSKNLVSIGHGAFSGATTIRDIYCGAEVPPTVASFPSEIYSTAKLHVPYSAIDSYSKANVWKNFYNIEAFDPNSTEIEKLNYVLNKEEQDAKVTFERRNNMSNYSGMTNVVIPESVEYMNVKYNIVGIGSEAFNYSWGLKSISLPATITSIDDLAFGYCTSLREIIIPAAVTSIGSEAFTGCSALATVTFEGNNIESIGDYAFFGCTGLSDLHIPSSVTSIGENAFMGVHWLNDVYAGSTTPADAPVSSFSTTAYKNATLHVPNGSLAAYQAHPTWSKFLTIKEEKVPSGIDDVDVDSQIKVYAKNGGIEFAGVNDGTMVQVYNISGANIYCGPATHLEFAPGVYVVVVNGKSYKIGL